jgi:hypothetical protein
VVREVAVTAVTEAIVVTEVTVVTVVIVVVAVVVVVTDMARVVAVDFRVVAKRLRDMRMVRHRIVRWVKRPRDLKQMVRTSIAKVVARTGAVVVVETRDLVVADLAVLHAVGTIWSDIRINCLAVVMGMRTAEVSRVAMLTGNWRDQVAVVGMTVQMGTIVVRHVVAVVAVVAVVTVVRAIRVVAMGLAAIRGLAVMAHGLTRGVLMVATAVMVVVVVVPGAQVVRVNVGVISRIAAGNRWAVVAGGVTVTEIETVGCRVGRAAFLHLQR